MRLWCSLSSISRVVRSCATPGCFRLSWTNSPLEPYFIFLWLSEVCVSSGLSARGFSNQGRSHGSRPAEEAGANLMRLIAEWTRVRFQIAE